MKNHPVIIAVIILAVSQFSSTCPGETDKTDRQAERKFVVSLVDGTSLVCKPLIKSLPLKTSYSDMEIPLDKLSGAVFDNEKKEATIRVSNGDQLKGTVPLEKLKVQTMLGEITISMAFIAEIADKTKPEEKPEKIADTPQRRNRCINNLRQIDAAKEQSALANKWADGAVAVIPVIVQYIKGEALPVCPAGGKYTVDVIGKNPKCSVPGHTLFSGE